MPSEHVRRGLCEWRVIVGRRWVPQPAARLARDLASLRASAQRLRESAQLFVHRLGGDDARTEFAAQHFAILLPQAMHGHRDGPRVQAQLRRPRSRIRPAAARARGKGRAMQSAAPCPPPRSARARLRAPRPETPVPTAARRSAPASHRKPAPRQTTPRPAPHRARAGPRRRRASAAPHRDARWRGSACGAIEGLAIEGQVNCRGSIVAPPECAVVKYA